MSRGRKDREAEDILLLLDQDAEARRGVSNRPYVSNSPIPAGCQQIRGIHARSSTTCGVAQQRGAAILLGMEVQFIGICIDF